MGKAGEVSGQMRTAPGSRAARKAAAAALLLVVLAAAPLSLPVRAQQETAQQVVFRDHLYAGLRDEQAEYYDVVGTLGLLRGEAGAGALSRPDEPVTRAELAVMIVRLLALGASLAPPVAPATPDQPAPPVLPFQDASSIPAWAAPSVATCYELGLMNGVPNGTGGLDFQPEGDLSGAEAAAVLLRALGDAADIAGGWPVGYVYRAYEVGLFSTEAVPGDWRFVEPMSPVARAQAVYLLHNAVFCSRDLVASGPGREGTFRKPALASRLSGYTLAIDLDPARRALLISDGRTLGLAPTLVVSGVTTRGDLIGQRVFWLRNDRGQVAYLRAYGREPAVAGVLASLRPSPDGRRVEAVVLDDGRTIPCAPVAVVEVNGLRWPFDPVILRPRVEVICILSQGRAVYVSAIQDDFPEGVVRALRLDPPAAVAPGAAPPEPAAPTTGTILARISMGEGDIPLLVTAETRITLNGQPADLSDLREWDVFTAATAGTVPKRALRLAVHRDRVTGRVREVYHRHTAGGLEWRVTVDAGSSGPAPALVLSPYCDHLADSIVPGEELTFCLDQSGQVTYFRAAPPGSAARVVKILRPAEARGRRFLTVDWRGAEVTYTLPPGLTPPAPGVLAKLSAGSDGAVATLKPVGPAGVEAVVVEVDPVGARLTLSRDRVTWTLHVRRVAVYEIPHPFGKDEIGAFLPLQALKPGYRVWLDSQSAPGYVLVFRYEGPKG